MRFWSFAGIWRDLRFALLALRRDPSFVATAAGSLALALGVVTSVYGIVDAATHPVNAVREPDRVVYVINNGQGAGRGYTTAAFAELVRNRQRVFSGTALVDTRSVSYVIASRADHGFGMFVSPEFFDVTGITPIAGRAFDPSDFVVASPPVALVGLRLWRTALGGQRSAIGRTIDIDGRMYTVVGVMPADASFRLGADLIMPAGRGELDTYPAVIGRLRAGVNPDSARGQLRRDVDPLLKATFAVGPRPFRTNFLPVTRPPEAMSDLHKMLLAASSLIVLIACANMVSLMLARGLGRNREYAVRFALGANRSSVVRQILIEALVCSIAAAVVGTVLAGWLFHLLSYRLTSDIPLLGVVALSLNWRVFAFASLAAVAAAILSAVYPALRASSTQIEQAMKNGSAAATRRAPMRHSPFVVVQVGLTLALLMAANLMVKSARELRDRDLGFNPRGLLSINTFVPRSLRDSLNEAELREAVMQTITAEPGVHSVATARVAAPRGSGVVVTLPGGGSRRSYITSYQEVSANYLATLGIRVSDGRDLAPGDELSEVGAAVVSRTAARSLWRGDNPIGQMITLADQGHVGPLVHVVGIAEDVAANISDPDVEAQPALYVATHDTDRLPTSFVVRASALAESRMLAQLSLRARSALPPRVSVSVGKYLFQLDAMVAIRYFLATLFIAFGVLALCLAMFGTFCVRSQDVARRAREFAVRISLGATSTMIVRSVLRDSVIIVLAGTGIGAFFAIYAARRLDPWLYGVFYSDVRALLLGEFLLVVTTLLASLAPALRAARSNPIEILRAT